MPTTTVRDIMTKIVETLGVGDTLETARQQIRRGRIRHLPVVDGEERVVGLITHRRILESWVSHGHPERESRSQVAGDIPVEMLMERDVLTVDPETSAAHAAKVLEAYKFGCLPVVERGKLVGIVTEADFVRFAQRYFEWEMSASTGGSPVVGSGGRVGTTGGTGTGGQTGSPASGGDVTSGCACSTSPTSRSQAAALGSLLIAAALMRRRRSRIAKN